MQDPVILHDHLYRNLPVFRMLFEEVETGKLNPNSMAAARKFILPDGTYADSIHTLWFMLVGYRHFGQQTFVVGPRFRAMLENTSLVGVPHDSIRFPYDYFYVALPESGHRLWGEKSGWHDVDGVVVGKSRQSGAFSLYIWGKENEKSTGPGDDASFWIDLSPEEARAKGQDMETYLSGVLSDRSRASSPKQGGFSEDYWKDVAVWAETKRTAIAVLRIVLNLSIYLQHDGVEKSEHPLFARSREERTRLQGALKGKNPKKKGTRHLQRELDKISGAHVTWLGEALESLPATETGAGTSPGVRFWVRGHWYPRLDNVEARTRHKLRWVRPYEKGTDLEPASPRQYKTRGDDSLLPTNESDPSMDERLVGGATCHVSTLGSSGE